MTENLHEAALAAWEKDYADAFVRLQGEGQPKLTALVLAQKEVTARRGAKPALIAKAFNDEGGPLAGQA